jgi:hypothetical protein
MILPLPQILSLLGEEFSITSAEVHDSANLPECSERAEEYTAVAEWPLEKNSKNGDFRKGPVSC